MLCSLRSSLLYGVPCSQLLHDADNLMAQMAELRVDVEAELHVGKTAMQQDLTKSETLRVSEMTTPAKCQGWMERTQLSIAYHDNSGYSGELSVNVHEVQPFEWPGSGGSSASVSKYMKFLEETIPPGDTNSWHDVSGKHQFLAVDAGKHFPRNMRGTSDAALCRSRDVANGTPSTGIRVLVETKLPGMDRGACLYQAATELVLANVHTPLCSPVVVLTDLREDWRILRLTQKSVMVWDLDGKGARAVSVIGRMLYEEQARDGRVIWLQQGEEAH